MLMFGVRQCSGQSMFILKATDLPPGVLQSVVELQAGIFLAEVQRERLGRTRRHTEPAANATVRIEDHVLVAYRERIHLASTQTPPVFRPVDGQPCTGSRFDSIESPPRSEQVVVHVLDQHLIDRVVHTPSAYTTEHTNPLTLANLMSYSKSHVLFRVLFRKVEGTGVCDKGRTAQRSPKRSQTPLVLALSSARTTGGRTRTDTVLPPPDFESGASTNFATPARWAGRQDT